MIMDLEGPNLSRVLQIFNRPFSFDCVALIALKLTSVVEFMHSKGIIHNSLSPSKILISRAIKADGLFLTDFKRARKVSIGTSNL